MPDTAVLVTDEVIRVVLAADNRWAEDVRLSGWRTLSEGRTRNLLEAAAPLLVAAERERIAKYRNAACAALRIAETASRYGNDPVTAERYRTAREALEGDDA
jgi:hypothetical protein